MPNMKTMVMTIDGARPQAQRFGQWVLELLAGLAPCR